MVLLYITAYVVFVATQQKHNCAYKKSRNNGCPVRIDCGFIINRVLCIESVTNYSSCILPSLLDSKMLCLPLQDGDNHAFQ